MGPFQAPAVAIWWRWSLVRLWVIISNRHSVRTAVAASSVESGDTSVVVGVTEYRLDHLFAFSVQLLAELAESSTYRIQV